VPSLELVHVPNAWKVRQLIAISGSCSSGGVRGGQKEVCGFVGVQTQARFATNQFLDSSRHSGTFQSDERSSKRGLRSRAIALELSHLAEFRGCGKRGTSRSAVLWLAFAPSAPTIRGKVSTDTAHVRKNFRLHLIGGRGFPGILGAEGVD
jgi:hypothetical protein